MSYRLIYWQNSNSINFSPQNEKYSNSKVSEKIKKMANTLIIFNSGSDVMITSFIIKERSGTIRHLGSAILN